MQFERTNRSKPIILCPNHSTRQADIHYGINNFTNHTSYKTRDQHNLRKSKRIYFAYKNIIHRGIIWLPAVTYIADTDQE